MSRLRTRHLRDESYSDRPAERVTVSEVNDPVVIACFLSSAEARAARDALGSEGMVAEVRPRDDLLPRRCTDAFDAGFDLVSGSADADRAIALLQALWPEERRTVALERCPACGSPDVARLRRLRLFIVAAVLMLAGGAVTGEHDLFLLMLGIVAILLLLTPNRRCRGCGERWHGAPPAPAEENATIDEIVCPACGSIETETIDRRREKAWTLLVNYFVPPTVLVWPFLRRRRCTRCGHEWR